MLTKIQALRLLRKIVLNHDDLLTQDASGSWEFNELEAHEWADNEPHNDVRQVEDATPGQPKPLPEATPMNHEHEHHGHHGHEAHHHHTPHGETFANGSHGHSHTGALSNLNPEPVHTTETVSLEGAEVVEVTQTTEQQGDTAVTKEPKPETEKQRERRELKESNKAKREANKAERERLNAEKAKRKADTKAQREADDAAKEARKAQRKASAQEKAATKAKNSADREARIAQRRAEAVNGVFKPQAGSTIAALWEVIDTLSDQLGRVPNFAEYSDGVQGSLEADKQGTPLTRTTAYYNYRRFHGIKVRNVKPEAEAVTAV